MLTLRHLTIFKTVAETGNFTKAAQKLYITQSAVSHTIRELEGYTGTSLFDRLSRQVRLTAQGRLLLDEILPILASCDALEERIRHLEMQAPLRIVSSITIAAFWLPRILNQLKEKLPDLLPYVTVESASDAIRTLSKGEADIAFLEGAQPQGPFHCIHFSDYSLVTVCAPGYFKENAPAALTLEEFCQEKLLLREPGSAIRDTLDSALFILGHTARPLWTSVNSTALLEAAKAGLGITVLPEMLVKEEIKKGTLLPLHIENLALKNDMIAVYHKDKYLTPGLTTLLSCTVNESLSS